MAAVNQAARVLRLDEGTWRWLDADASVRGAGLVVIGAYLILAFDRFGWPDSAFRATTRTLLVGLYGWLWLAVVPWIVVRMTTTSRAPLSDYMRLTGHAHLPLLLVAILVFVLPVSLGVSGIALWPALFAGVVWMPAMLVNAVATAAGVSRRSAALPALVPYVVWAAVAGRWLWRQIGHLL